MIKHRALFAAGVSLAFVWLTTAACIEVIVQPYARALGASMLVDGVIAWFKFFWVAGAVYYAYLGGFRWQEHPDEALPWLRGSGGWSKAPRG